MSLPRRGRACGAESGGFGLPRAGSGSGGLLPRRREPAALIASRWVWQENGDEAVLRKDLGQVANALAAESKKYVAANAAPHGRHPSTPGERAMSNSQKGLNPPTERGAEYAIHAVALIIRELGWARSEG